MFVCKDCTHPEDRGMFYYMPLSKGPCENCKYTDICVDARPRINPNWREEVKRSLEAYKASQK